MPLIFPEGRITVTGNLMKTYPGAGVIAENISDGSITPIILNGLQYSTVSHMHGKLPLRWFPQVSIDIFPPQRLQPPLHLRGPKKHQWLTNRMEYIMEEAVFNARKRKIGNLTTRFAASVRTNGGATKLFAEFPNRQLSYRQVFTAAFAVGGVLKKRHMPGSRIGLLLPSSVGAAVCFYAALFQRLTPVLLNPGTGPTQVLSACQVAAVDTVYTAERLLERSPTTVQIVETLKASGIAVILLESVRKQLTLSDKLKAAASSLFLQRTARRLPGASAPAEAPAVVLFTSGSEGVPKGVVLSHRNLLTNCEQVLSRIDVTHQDIMLNTLPIFHSFGLLAGVVLPLVAGVKAWQYPSPLHYKMVPEALYASNATIFFSANTFLSHYGKAAHPLDMRALRLVVAGAEKLRDETRQLWADKFGVRILEGYGVTETSPALAVNTPLHNLVGSVGRMLPGIQTRMEKVEGITHGGRLWVKGDNIMAGYFTAAAPGELKPPPDGWHDTGDIAELNGDNYLTIHGRAKRFIKIAGEMVPLDGIEECLKRQWEGMFAAVGIADARRGESLVLMTTANISREDITAVLRREALPEIWLPRLVRVVDEIPLLSTGKIDYPAVSRTFDKA